MGGCAVSVCGSIALLLPTCWAQHAWVGGGWICWWCMDLEIVIGRLGEAVHERLEVVPSSVRELRRRLKVLGC